MDELGRLLERHARTDMTTAIEGVRICRVDHVPPPASSMSGTVLAVVARGVKRLALGERLFDYGPGQYLVASVDLPVTGHVISPAIGFGMTLEPAIIADLLQQAGPGDLPPTPAGVRPGIAVSDAPEPLLDSVVRLLRLLDRPRDRRAMAPLLKREIHWWLMAGEQGEAVRQLGLADSGLGGVQRAVRWIRDNYTLPFQVADMAKLAGMSVSTFNRHFRTVTAMSPIQFQKQIRLQSARLLLPANPRDITGVAYRVGYDSPSQFSREYRRLFGLPPSADAARIREGTPALP